MTVPGGGVAWRTEDELERRRMALVLRLAERGLDGVLVTSDTARTWLTGFDAASHDTQPAAVALIGMSRSALLTSANNTAWATSLSPGIEVVAWKRPWWSDLAQHVLSTGWARVGFEADSLTVAGWNELRRDCGDGVAFEDLGSVVTELRAIKSELELESVRRAVAITDAAFVDATRELREGVSERDLAWRLEQAMVANGADRPGFGTIVAAGLHAARPHHAPTDTPIRAGEPVIIDMGAMAGAYSGDLTRTIWVGDASDRLRELYPLVLRANRAAIAAARAGATGREVDSAGRDLIAAAGYGPAFVHGLGHGVGLEIHEAPAASQASTDVLAAGNTLTIEPGIYLPDWGGIRIEDFGVVTDAGFEVLSTAPYQAI